ncbi:MAG: HlyD family efflux transporter periplasmic adaptor subunit [Gammaproteobacteria bacterium]
MNPSPSSFSRTLARLQSQRNGWTVACAGGAVVVLALWCWWAASWEVTLHETSTSARVEVDSSSYALQASLPGRVVRNTLRVGAHVRRGDVLVELDSAPQALELREIEVRIERFAPELARLRAELAAERRASVEERRVSDVTGAEARSRLQAASAEAQFSNAELARVQALRASGLLSRSDLDKATLGAEKLRADAEALRHTLEGVPRLQGVRESERAARIERLRGSMEKMESEARIAAATAERLRYEIETRRIRAPVDGVIGEINVLRTGSFVDEGTPVASLVADGKLIVVAEFPAQRALGRIREGQVGTLRLDAFPWAEFGTVAASVVRVGSEVHHGTVPVELTIDGTTRFVGRLQHGMPGSLDLPIERITPLTLLLRTAGRAITRAQTNVDTR